MIPSEGLDMVYAMLHGCKTECELILCIFLLSDDDEKDVDEYILELVENCTSKNEDLQGV